MSPANCNYNANSVDPQLPSAALDLTAVVLHVERCHLRAGKAMSDSVLAAFEAGSALLAAKRAVSHGSWTDTLKAAIRSSGAIVTPRTCQRYMQVAEVLQKRFDSLALEHASSPSKTTRATFLKLLLEQKLTSIGQVIKPEQRKREKELNLLEPGGQISVPSYAPTSACDSDFITPPSTSLVQLEAKAAD